jgi:RecA/RadA recombinase
MTTLEIIKKINKDRLTSDYVKPFSELTDLEKTPLYCSTGSPYLDYKINGGKGLKLGLMSIFVGAEGSLKTSLALSLAHEVIKMTGKYAIFFDAEHTTDETYVVKSGIDQSKFLRIPTSVLEDMLNMAEEFSRADDVGIIIFDSLPTFYSKVIEQKNAEENSIGVEAKKFNARIPIIFGNAANRNIITLPLTFYKLDPGVIGGDPRKMPRGEWQKFYSSLTLDLTRKEFILDDSGKAIGQITKARIKKSKLGPFNPKDDFELRYYFDTGFDQVYDKASILLENNIIVRGGAWYTLPNGEKMQGFDGVLTYLRDNEEYLDDVYSNFLRRISQ